MISTTESEHQGVSPEVSRKQSTRFANNVCSALLFNRSEKAKKRFAPGRKIVSGTELQMISRGLAMISPMKSPSKKTVLGSMPKRPKTVTRKMCSQVTQPNFKDIKQFPNSPKFQHTQKMSMGTNQLNEFQVRITPMHMAATEAGTTLEGYSETTSQCISKYPYSTTKGSNVIQDGNISMTEKKERKKPSRRAITYLVHPPANMCESINEVIEEEKFRPIKDRNIGEIELRSVDSFSSDEKPHITLVTQPAQQPKADKMMPSELDLERQARRKKRLDAREKKFILAQLDRSISKFVVLTGSHCEVKTLTRTILSALVKTLTESFELHAYGTAELQGAEKITKSLDRWMEVSDIQTGWKFGDKYMVVKFIGTYRIHDAFIKAKDKTQVMGERKSMLMARRLAMSPQPRINTLDSDSD